MYFRQTDLFWGLNQSDVNRAMAIAERAVFAKGEGTFNGGNHGKP